MERGVPAEIAWRDIHRRGDIVAMCAEQIDPRLRVVVSQPLHILPLEGDDVRPHIGNAPRRCHNCGRYFLLTAGYNTCYCNNIAPGEIERTCRKVGAYRKEARGKENRTPAQKEYERTYNRLKTRKQRGKISVDEWNVAVARAQAVLDLAERGELTDEETRKRFKAF